MMKRLVLGALLVGCGGDDGGGGAVDLDSLGLEIGIASCGQQFACCTDAEIMQQFMGITYEDQPITTEEQCVAFTDAVFTAFGVSQYKASIALGRMEYDAAAAADCIAAIERLSCAQYSAGVNAGMAPACRPFMVPKVTDGGGCTQDHECASANCEGATVQPGGASTDGTCRPMPTAGQGCDDNCADGLYCGLDPSSGMAVCQTAKADGATCDRDRECTSAHCDDALRTCATPPLTCDGR